MLNDIIGTIVAVAMSIGGAFGDLANFFTPGPAATPPPTSVTQLPPPPSAAGNRDPFHTEIPQSTEQQHETPSEDVNSPILSKAGPPVGAANANPPGRVLGESTSSPLPQPIFVTHAELTTALNLLANNLHLDLAQQIANQQQPTQPVFVAPTLTFSGPAATTPVSTATFAHSQKIDQLSNVTLTNATVNGVSGLTDADIPDSLTASNYLPLSGGTLTGDLALSGTLTAGTLSVAGISSAGALIGPYVTATSTLATSTFAGALSVGTNALTVLQNGYTGIGTASPSTKFHLYANDTSFNRAYIEQNGAGRAGLRLRPRREHTTRRRRSRRRPKCRARSASGAARTEQK